MSSEWPTVTLRTAGVSLIDCVHKTPEAASDGFPYVTIPQMVDGRIDFANARRINASDFEAWTKKARPKPWDVVLSRRCNPGETVVVAPGEEFALGQNLVLLRADGTRVFPPFLRWLTRSPEWREQVQKNLNVGAVFDSLKCVDIPNFELRLPPLREQEVIADTLGELDDKIEHNRRRGRALEELAREIFKAWFVDFEPGKAKAAGATSFPGMPHAAFDALPDCLADSQLGTVPEGWEVQTVSDVTTLSKQQIKPQDHPDELFEHFSIPAYDAGQNPVAEPGSGILSQKFVVVPDCVLLSKLNPRIPRVWMPAPANGRRQIASTEFLVAVPRPGWTREFLYCLFQQREFRDNLAQSASGTSNSHQRVRPSDLLTHPLVVPPKTILDAFTDHVIPLMALREALQAESSKLAGLRDYLLPRLMSGLVRVTSLRTLEQGTVCNSI